MPKTISDAVYLIKNTTVHTDALTESNNQLISDLMDAGVDLMDFSLIILDLRSIFPLGCDLYCMVYLEVLYSLTYFHPDMDFHVEQLKHAISNEFIWHDFKTFVPITDIDSAIDSASSINEKLSIFLFNREYNKDTFLLGSLNGTVDKVVFMSYEF